MGRKTAIFIGTDDRDKNKRFIITEMPALKAERWALRALMALANSGVELSSDIRESGFAGLAYLGLDALQKLKYEDVGVLLDEMLDCVRIAPDPKNPDSTRELVLNEREGDDIEEVSTLLKMRQKIFELHASFFLQEKT